MFRDFKPVLIVLLRFIVLYILLLFAYQFYLKKYEGKGLDAFSQSVASQVVTVQNRLGYPTVLYDMPKYETTKFLINGTSVTRMVEGCNAVSVMILFVAFVLAFYRKFFTLIFIAVSLLLLHILNVARIAGLNIVYYDYPSYGKMVHDYLFPAVIYGSVVILWIVWVKVFAIKKS